MRKTKNVIQVPATNVTFSLMSLSKETSANHPLGMKVKKNREGFKKKRISWIISRTSCLL